MTDLKGVKYALKSIDDGVASMDVEVKLDRERRTVTLSMSEFESDMVVNFARDALPADFGVRIDDLMFEHVISLPLFALVIELGGRRHPTRLQHLADGRVTLRLLACAGADA